MSDTQIVLRRGIHVGLGQVMRLVFQIGQDWFTILTLNERFWIAKRTNGRAKLELTSLRIIGGSMRSRKIQFAVDPRTRPMKDRTRQAVMNLLGGTFENAIAFDLFGGTGVLGFEALSRGASHAYIFEILRSAVREIQQNAQQLGVADQISVVHSDVIAWSADLQNNLVAVSPGLFGTLSDGSDEPKRWVVFCCPPYALWNSDGERLHDMLHTWIAAAPAGSLFAVELEEPIESTVLPSDLEWDIRIYRPAKMAIGEK